MMFRRVNGRVIPINQEKQTGARHVAGAAAVGTLAGEAAAKISKQHMRLDMAAGKAEKAAVTAIGKKNAANFALKPIYSSMANKAFKTAAKLDKQARAVGQRSLRTRKVGAALSGALAYSGAVKLTKGTKYEDNIAVTGAAAALGAAVPFAVHHARAENARKGFSLVKAVVKQIPRQAVKFGLKKATGR